MHIVTELSEGLSISWGAILSNKMRAALTTLGIVIGIVTVTLMGTAIEGLNRAFLKSISAMGSDVFYVDRFAWMNHTHAEWMRSRKRQNITLQQIRALESQMKLAMAVAPFANAGAPVKYKNRSSRFVDVIGTTEKFVLTSSSTSVADGRFLTPDEVEGGRPVCVLGSQTATNLFVLESPLGKTIRLGPYAFDVVGVLEKQGSFLGQFSLDNQVIIPVKQFASCFWRDPSFTIQVKAADPNQMDEAKEELRGLLRKIRHVPPGAPDDFAINQQEMLIATFNRIAGTIAGVGLFITGLSLFVGGIGIMNIMFVSVAERTREIGIRKAIGAKRRAILLQVLMEAAGICLLGGCIGLAIAYPVTLLMNRYLPATMSLMVVSIALLVSIVTGVASGFFPAWRAARMDPVDALRSE